MIIRHELGISFVVITETITGKNEWYCSQINDIKFEQICQRIIRTNKKNVENCN